MNQPEQRYPYFVVPLVEVHRRPSSYRGGFEYRADLTDGYFNKVIQGTWAGTEERALEALVAAIDCKVIVYQNIVDQLVERLPALAAAPEPEPEPEPEPTAEPAPDAPAPIVVTI